MNHIRRQLAFVSLGILVLALLVGFPAEHVKALHLIDNERSNAVRSVPAAATATVTPTPACAPDSPLSLAYLPSSTYVRDIYTLPDGSFLLVGRVDDSEGTWLARIDSSGQLLWQKVYGSRMGSIQLAANGNIVLSFTRANLEIGLDGSVIRALGVPWYYPNADGSFTIINGSRVARYQDWQTPLWQLEIKDFGGINTTTSDGGALFAYAGAYVDKSVYYAPFYTDIKVIKVLPNGQVVQRVYGRLVGDESLEYLQPSADGGALLAGTHYYQQLGSETDIWLMKVNAGGGLSWQTTFRLAPFGETLRKITPLNKGYLVEIATVESNDPYLVRLASNGRLLWQKVFRSSRGQVEISAAADTADGGLVLAGRTSERTSVSWLAKIDAKGRLVWEKTIGLDVPGTPGGEVMAIQALTNKQILLGGLTNQLGSSIAPQYSAWIAKIPDSGNPLGLIELLPGKISAVTTLGVRPNTLPDQIGKGDGAALKEITYSVVELDLLAMPACQPSDLVLPTPAVLPSLTPTLAATPSATPTQAFTRSLYLADPRMQGDDVLLLQQRLYDLGYTEVGARDGIFGRLTDAAVRSFQTKNDLAVDGIVGPKTWKRLFSLDAIGVGK